MKNYKVSLTKSSSSRDSNLAIGANFSSLETAVIVPGGGGGPGNCGGSMEGVVIGTKSSTVAQGSTVVARSQSGGFGVAYEVNLGKTYQ